MGSMKKVVALAITGLLYLSILPPAGAINWTFTDNVIGKPGMGIKGFSFFGDPTGIDNLSVRARDLVADNSITLGGELRSTWPSFSIADNSITPAKLQHNEGTADETTFYRGDGKWVKRFRGALVTGDAIEQSIPNATPTPIQWEVEEYDSDGIFTAADNTKLTVPAGVTRVRLSGNSVAFGPVSPTGVRAMGMKKNGAYVPGGFYIATVPEIQEAAETGLNGTSAILSVSEGDYFQLIVHQTYGDAVNYCGTTDCWFSMEIIE